MNRLYAPVAERAGHRCEYCHAPDSIFNFPFEVEHIVPTAHGGIDEESNLALARRAGNLFKADHLTGNAPTTRKPVRLFHPRKDRWEDHFEVDAESGAIRGLTHVGRATEARLQLNSLLQLEARRLWMRLRIFP
jgi:hypothetical protein